MISGSWDQAPRPALHWSWSLWKIPFLSLSLKKFSKQKKFSPVKVSSICSLLHLKKTSFQLLRPTSVELFFLLLSIYLTCQKIFLAATFRKHPVFSVLTVTSRVQDITFSHLNYCLLPSLLASTLTPLLLVSNHCDFRLALKQICFTQQQKPKLLQWFKRVNII